MNNLINDLTLLTGVSKNALDELTDKANLAIAHCVFETLREGNPLTSIDIGVGTLYIKLEDENIKYRFVPNKNLEALVSQAATSKSSPLSNRAEMILNKRIQQTYKDLL